MKDEGVEEIMPLPWVPLSPRHNDPAVTQAFIKLTARVKQILDAGLIKNESIDLVEESPFTADLGWIKDNLNDPADEGEFVGHFAGQMAGQFERVGIAVDNLSAIKVLAQRLKTGYETISSLARTISMCAVSVNYALDPEAESEERVTRFAADIIAQVTYARRIGFGMISNWTPPRISEPGGAESREGTPEYVASLIEEEGLQVVWSKGKSPRPIAVSYGTSRSDVNWRISDRSRKIDSQGHFGWLLTSGVAHTEPWATRSLNEGSVDFYATMARAIIIPSAKSIAFDMGRYFGFPADGIMDRIKQADNDFANVISPILTEAVFRLPEDDPRRLQFERNMFDMVMDWHRTLGGTILSLPEEQEVSAGEWGEPSRCKHPSRQCNVQRRESEY